MKETAMRGSGQYRYGKLMKNRYKSTFLGYKCKAPKGAIFSMEDDLLRMSGINPGLRETNPTAFREAYFTGQAVMDMVLTLENGSSVAVYWQYYPASGHSPMDVARLVAERQIKVNQEKGWEPEGVVHTVEIMGRVFQGISSGYMNDWGHMEYIKEFFYECTNGMITVAVKTNRYNLSDADLLLKLLKKA